MKWSQEEVKSLGKHSASGSRTHPDIFIFVEQRELIRLGRNPHGEHIKIDWNVHKATRTHSLNVAEKFSLQSLWSAVLLPSCFNCTSVSALVIAGKMFRLWR